MSGRTGALTAVLATLLAFAAFNACVGYLLWGVGLGMHDIEWLPLFPLWLLAFVVTTLVALRSLRERRVAVTVTAVLCALCTIAFVSLAWGLGLWACSDGGGCHGPLTRAHARLVSELPPVRVHVCGWSYSARARARNA